MWASSLPGNVGIGLPPDGWNGAGGKSGDAAVGGSRCGWPGQLKSCGGGCFSGNDDGGGEVPRDEEKSWERKKPDW
jgi:hypothetical protein